VFSAPLRSPARVNGEGVGLRYVKTRLEESYPGRWNIESFPKGDVWQTAIEFVA
jgi:hypothetical protein